MLYTNRQLFVDHIQTINHLWNYIFIRRCHATFFLNTFITRTRRVLCNVPAIWLVYEGQHTTSGQWIGPHCQKCDMDIYFGRHTSAPESWPHTPYEADKFRKLYEEAEHQESVWLMDRKAETLQLGKWSAMRMSVITGQMVQNAQDLLRSSAVIY